MKKEKSPAFQFYPKDYKYPNASFYIDAKEYLSTSQICGRTKEEVGLLFIELCNLALNGEFDQIKKYVFIKRTLKGWQKRKSLPLDIRRKVLSLGYCVYCNSTERLTVDHIYPVSRGGSDEIENLQCLCWDCNRKKGASING